MVYHCALAKHFKTIILLFYSHQDTVVPGSHAIRLTPLPPASKPTTLMLPPMKPWTTEFNTLRHAPPQHLLSIEGFVPMLNISATVLLALLLGLCQNKQ